MGLRGMKPVSLLVAVAIVAIQGCAGARVDAVTAIPTGALDVTGSWTVSSNGPVVPGNSFLLTMNDSSGTVSGGGSFAGEAGPFGTLQVRGSRAQDSLRLQIVYVFDSRVFPSLNPDTANFVGKLTSKNEIDGAFTRDGTTSPIEFVRVRN